VLRTAGLSAGSLIPEGSSFDEHFRLKVDVDYESKTEATVLQIK
jgi:hypothetical protein